jgi:hypothetical protein
MERSLECRIFTECEQFYLEDSLNDDWPDWLDEIEGHRLLAVKEDCISIGTITNSLVRVELEYRHSRPDNEDRSAWDQVNECTFHVPSGRIVMSGIGEDGWGIDVAPGTYAGRIYYGQLGAPPVDIWNSNEHYKIAVWEAASAPIRVLKCRLCHGICRFKTILQTEMF